MVAPLSHGAGVHFLPQLARGVVSVLPEGPGLAADQVWRLVAQHHITNMFTVPTILNRLTSDPSVNAHDHSSLRCVIYAGAPMYRADQIQALEKLGKVLVQYFGLGEVTGNITVLPAHEHHLGRDPHEGTCGYARTGIDISIQSESGEVLPPHSPGEICIAGGAVFAGYYKAPELTAECYTEDGFFKTGDRGEYTDDGLLRITGRVKELFKTSKGKYVAPVPIENLINNHHLIEISCVSGPGRQACHAIVQLDESLRGKIHDSAFRKQAGEELEALLHDVNSKIEEYECVQFIAVAGEPWEIANDFLTPTLKIKRDRIEAAYAPQLDAWYDSGQRIIWPD